MIPSTTSLMLVGPAGAIEARLDQPSGEIRGTAVIAHPHPLHGGTMDNKVVQTVARAFVQSGWRAIRFNFRGVGLSDGAFDDGHGESDDLRAVIEQMAPDGPLALAGFSFGSFVAARVATGMAGGREPASLVLVGTAVGRFDVAPIPVAWHARTLVVHGEADETVPLGDVMAWARPQSLPVTVLPATSHFFHGQLPSLRYLVTRHLDGAT
jgi:uncharacterized protein